MGFQRQHGGSGEAKFRAMALRKERGHDLADLVRPSLLPADLPHFRSLALSSHGNWTTTLFTFD